MDYLEGELVGNRNELFTVSNWKNQVGTKLENLTYNVTRTESKVDEANTKLTITEHKNKRYGTKLARLSKNLQRLQKLTGDIESLKSQIAMLEKAVTFNGVAHYDLELNFEKKHMFVIERYHSFNH